MLEETNQTEEIVERVAALDIGKAELVCGVRVPGAGKRGRRLQEVTTYATMTRSLVQLADRLAELGVARVVLEATSDYWKAPFYLLEAQGLEVWLVNAREVKHLPGRPKTDKLDAVWLAKLAERGMLRPSFVPPAPIRRLRDLTRYRADLVAVRTAEKQRVEKLLEDAQIKLSVVASDIFGVSGRAMLAALIHGERDPKRLAELARTRLRAKRGQLQEAFTGQFTDHHGFLLATMLGRIDQASADIANSTARSRPRSPLSRRRPSGWMRSPALAAPPRRRSSPRSAPTWAASPPRPPGLLGPVRARRQPVGGQGQGQGHDGAWQPVSGPGAGRGRRGRRADRHLLGGALSAHRPPPRRQEGDRGGGPLHPGHRLAPAGRPHHPLSRAWARLL